MGYSLPMTRVNNLYRANDYYFLEILRDLPSDMIYYHFLISAIYLLNWKVIPYR